MQIERPTDSEYAPFYQGYVDRVPDVDVMGVLEAQVDEVRRMAASVSAERETYRYASGKWSIRQVVGHLTDAERVFGYRAFRISRGDRTPLPGFDENEYIEQSQYADERVASLADEFASVRESNLAALRRLDASRMALMGTVSGTPTSVRAIAFIMAGHVRHHRGLLRERYDVDVAH